MRFWVGTPSLKVPRGSRNWAGNNILGPHEDRVWVAKSVGISSVGSFDLKEISKFYGLQ